MTFIRQPAVAGQFYPDDPQTLRAAVGDLLRQVAADAPESQSDPAPNARPRAPGPRALIVPHAAYPFSGPIAASAFARLKTLRHAVRRVLLLGPAHHMPLQGLAASSAAAFATPLGPVPLDRAARDDLLQRPFVHLNDRAHEPEHGLEVQLPFLQTLLDAFTLVPLVSGPCAPEDIAAALRPFATSHEAGGQDLIVVSSDLSHFLDYDRARRLDHHTARRIETLNPLAAADACGRVAINGLLHLARQQGWLARTLDLRSSGDTGGPHHRVVGYGAFIFH